MNHCDIHPDTKSTIAGECLKCWLAQKKKAFSWRREWEPNKDTSISREFICAKCQIKMKFTENEPKTFPNGWAAYLQCKKCNFLLRYTEIGRKE